MGLQDETSEAIRDISRTTHDAVLKGSPLHVKLDAFRAREHELLEYKIVLCKIVHCFRPFKVDFYVADSFQNWI